MPAFSEGREQPQRSNHNSLDLIKADLIASAIIELGRTRRSMVCHGGSFLKRAAVFEVGGDPCRPETVIAELGGDARCRGAPADHRIGICLWQHGAGQLGGTPADCAE